MIDTKALRNKILDMAISGKLTEQLPEDGNAEDLYAQIQEEKARLIAEGKIKKEKPLPPITEEETPFEIPENWKWVRFSEIVDFYLGKTPARANKDYWEDAVYPWVSISDMPNNGIIYETKEGISEVAKEECFSNAISKAGTLIMSFKLTIGKVAILGVDAYHNEAIISIFPFYNDDETIKTYLFRILPVVASNTDSHGVVMGTTLNKKSMSNMLIPLPPIAEQKRIVSAVEDAFAVIGRIEKVQASYFADQEVLKNKIIDAGIRGKLTEQLPEDGNAEDLYAQIQEEKARLIAEGKIKKEKPLPPITEEEIPFEIPRNWKWVRWGDLSQKIQYGYNAPAKANGKIKMVRISDIQNGKVQWDTVPFCDINDEEISAYILKPNDILFARTGGTVGKSYLVKEVPEEAVYAGYLIRTQYSESLSSDYMKHFMESTLYWSQLQDGTIATAQPNCNGKTLSKMIVPLPPSDEQKRIMDLINKIQNITENA